MSQLLSCYLNQINLRLTLIVDCNNIAFKNKKRALNKYDVCIDFDSYASGYQNKVALDTTQYSDVFGFFNFSKPCQTLIQAMMIGRKNTLYDLMDEYTLYITGDTYTETGTSLVNLHFPIASLARRFFSEFYCWRINSFNSYEFSIEGVSKSGKLYYFPIFIGEASVLTVQGHELFDDLYDDNLVDTKSSNIFSNTFTKLPSALIKSDSIALD